jgi:hypothetical protein
MAVVDNNGNKHQIRVSIPKFWQIDDESLQNELKTAHL